MTNKEKQNLMTVKEVCLYLQIHPMTFYRWAKSGKLPTVKLGNRYRVVKSKLDKLFESNPKEKK